MAILLTEFVGTFFLVFTIGLTVLAETPFAAVAIGAGLTALVYMGRHISGAHYNPAVSVGIYMRGRMDAKDLIPYWVAQIAGAAFAAIMISVLMGATYAPAPGRGASLVQVLLAEALFTFALTLVILNVATAKATEGNSYYGLAIGFTVLSGSVAVGDISGGAFNPAVGTGPILIDTLMGNGSMTNLWLYWVGPMIGGALAAVAFKIQNPDDA